MNNPTDTNQASDLYELCKKVYELTKWDNYCEYWSFGGEYTVNKDSMTSIEVETAIIPLYTSDYLLEKLPEHVIEYDSYHEQDICNYLCVTKVPDGYIARYDGLSLAHKVKVQRSDTPLKSLLKLTLALHEAGKL